VTLAVDFLTAAATQFSIALVSRDDGSATFDVPVTSPSGKSQECCRPSAPLAISIAMRPSASAGVTTLRRMLSMLILLKYGGGGCLPFCGCK
jgi:hypothetical protein